MGLRSVGSSEMISQSRFLRHGIFMCECIPEKVRLGGMLVCMDAEIRKGNIRFIFHF